MKLTCRDDGTVVVPLDDHAGIAHGPDLGLKVGPLTLVHVHVLQRGHDGGGGVALHHLLALLLHVLALDMLEEDDLLLRLLPEEEVGVSALAFPLQTF